MAVLLNTDQGALIDHALLLKRVYSNVEIDSKRSGSYLLKTKLFKIDRPFKTDSQVLAEQTAEGKGIPRRNRKVRSLIHALGDYDERLFNLYTVVCMLRGIVSL